MGGRINGETVTSDITLHNACRLGTVEDRGAEVWAVSWLPKRRLTRNQATTAMVLAERVSQGVTDRNHKHWPFIEGWAEELGLSGSATVDKISYTEHAPR